MPHFKLILSYDGATFHGWQVQPRLATIQGTLAAALHHLTGETVLPQGSGRTDAGVHALAQVATFPLSVPIPPANLLRALNRALPAGIRILSAEHVPETFHARHSAVAKSYEYRIFERRPRLSATAPSPDTTPDRICTPFLAPYVWDCPWSLDFTAMQTAATHLLGTHNFLSFAAADPDQTQRAAQTLSSRPEQRTLPPHNQESPEFDDAERAETPTGPNPIKTITTSTLTEEHGLLIYRITGSGFLHHMVRNIVGTLTDIGRGALTPSDIPHILAAQDRTAAGPTAPAAGLFLHTVHYNDPLTPENEPPRTAS